MVTDNGDDARLVAALERALPWLNGLCRMTGYDGLRWSAGQVKDIIDTRDEVKAALDAVSQSGRTSQPRKEDG